MSYIFSLLATQTKVLDKVPDLSVAALIVSVGLIVAIPTVSILFIRKRCEMTLRSMLYGMSCYILASYVFQQLFSVVIYTLLVNVVKLDETTANIVYAIMFNIITIIVEIGGIYLCLLLINRHLQGTKNAVGVAIGYASMEIVMIMGMSVFVFAALILTLNANGLEELLKTYPSDADLESIRASYQSLIDMKWYEYLIYGVQSLCIAVVRYCMIGIMYGVSVGKMNKNGILVVALFSMIFKMPDLCYQVGILKTTVSVEIVYVVVTIIIALITRQVVYMNLMDLVREIIKPKKKEQAKMPKIVMPK